MIISSTSDYRKAAQAKLPPFLFHYIDGGSYNEHTLRRNCEDLSSIALKQRVLKNMSDIDITTKVFGESFALPIALSPVGLTGMYSKRGEVQAALAAEQKVFLLPCQRFQYALLKRWLQSLKGPCGFSSMY